MKPILLALLVVVCPLSVRAQSSTTKMPSHPSQPVSQDIQTEKIVAPSQAPPTTSTQTLPAGVMEPAQVKALMHKLWLTQFRLNDLLAQIHPEKWKMAPAVRASFGQSLDSLHSAMTSVEDWRAQFEARPDSLYLGFQTYVAIGAVVPRVEGLAQSVAHFENASFGGQYSQAGNQLFDIQQAIEPHLSFLLKAQDNVLLVAQTNLAGCQNELNFAEHDREGHATPMKNIAPEFKGVHKRPTRATAPASTPKKVESKVSAGHKPAVKPASPAPGQ